MFFVHRHSFFTELHFLRHIRLGHQGIGEHNPSADLQTLCCEFVARARHRYIYSYSYILPLPPPFWP